MKKLSQICFLFVLILLTSSSAYANNKKLKGLFPSIEPSNVGYLHVDTEHALYWEESGNPEGIPVLVLHGGPGAGTNADMRRYFDPLEYRIILFDQRGSGKSTPVGSLNNNTTWDLIEDINIILDFLDVEKPIICGGSWGSTLGLTYAITYPDRVKGLILRGIFLGRTKELDWFYKRGANILSPQAWQLFLDPIPVNERDDLIAAYYYYLNSDDPNVRKRAACAWAVWEFANSQLEMPVQLKSLLNTNLGYELFVAYYGLQMEPMARIECHYFINKCFLDTDNWIIENIGRIRSIPTIMIQGRYDLICPLENAWELHEAWPEATLEVVQSGHSAAEPEILDAIIRATETFKQQLFTPSSADYPRL